MPRDKQDWEKDKEFCTIAAFVWQDDHALATRRAAAKNSSVRSAARQRMRIRYEGFMYAELLEARVEGMQLAVQAVVRHMRGKPK